MPSSAPPSQNLDAEQVRLEEIGHPRGTLAIVILFGLAFGIAWFAMYIFEFLRRGATHS
ncbi:MAG TPA: hypothetical protein VMI93_02325 [Candidatus Solibacter sp.]|nr:hypothetical protein [Candidatus Solibacter sp.]